jgi:pyridoxal phosphate enzyme (YggS family)
MIEENIKRIKEEIFETSLKYGKNYSDIEIVGVTKTVEPERILPIKNAGITHIGENRVQEYLYKYDFYKENNFKKSIIGHLQTNKVKYIIDKVDLIQSVDSLKLAEEISKQAKKHNKTMEILLEINIAGEVSKSGVSYNEVFEFAHKISELDNILVKGIMAIPPIFETESITRGYFEKLYKIYIDIKSKKIDNIYMDILSMGMSKDYLYAIMEGSNMVRIGTGIFGKRTNM